VITNLTTKDKYTETAERQLEQARARLADKQKKENEKRRKAENHHKYMMGGIIVKYFPECYHFEEAELNEILSKALYSADCRETIKRIKVRCSQMVNTEKNYAGNGNNEMQKAEVSNENLS